MDQFTIECSELLVGGMPLSRLADRLGQAPFCAVGRLGRGQRCRDAGGAQRRHASERHQLCRPRKAEEAPALLGEMGAMGLAFLGFHLYAGSQNLKDEAMVKSLQKSYELACRLSEPAPGPVKVLNLGGGFGIPCFPGEQRLGLAPIGDNLATIAQDAAQRLPQAELIVELARFMLGEVGLYVCRVMDRKVSRGHASLEADSGLNHHLSNSGNFGQMLRKNYSVAVGNRMG